MAWMHMNTSVVKMGLMGFFCLVICHQALAADHLRGQRYCEVIFWHGLSGFVYNTLNLNNCPPKLWSKLTPSLVKKDTGSHFAYLNGPRYYVVDAIENDTFSTSEVKTFGDIAMHPTVTMRIKLKDILVGAAPYREHQVEHSLVCIYRAGKPVYELVDPKGHVFVMQSYTNAVKPQKAENLVSLDKHLNLPKGWSFRTGILTSDKFVVTRDNHALVLLDNFKNIYQKVSEDLLTSSNSSTL